jgi:hypothetical protein
MVTYVIWLRTISKTGNVSKGWDVLSHVWESTDLPRRLHPVYHSIRVPWL